MFRAPSTIVITTEDGAVLSFCSDDDRQATDVPPNTVEYLAVHVNMLCLVHFSLNHGTI